MNITDRISHLKQAALAAEESKADLQLIGERCAAENAIADISKLIGLLLHLENARESIDATIRRLGELDDKRVEDSMRRYEGKVVVLKTKWDELCDEVIAARKKKTGGAR